MKKNKNPITVAVITGGHPYDVPNFHRLFRGLPSLDCYIQNIYDFSTSSESVRDAYDVVVFFNFNLTPVPEGEEKTVIEHLSDTGQGIVVLHHALWSYPQWPLWTKLSGIANGGAGAKDDVAMRVELATTQHPITAGLQSWDIIDETYKMEDAAPDSEILITTEAPDCIHTIAWTRKFGKSRVFCLELGHDNQAWPNENFRIVLERGIVWSTAQ